MTKTRFTLGVAIVSIVILLAGNALADPTEVAQYTDPRSGDHFELYQEDDGSFFCSVQRLDGTLSGFEIDEGRVRAGEGEVCPDIRSIAKQYYNSTGRRDTKNPPEARGLGRNAASQDREDRKPCPVCNHEDNSKAKKGIEKDNDNRKDLCYHPDNPDSPGHWKTVSLILLLMLSERGAS